MIVLWLPLVVGTVIPLLLGLTSHPTGNRIVTPCRNGYIGYLVQAQIPFVEQVYFEITILKPETDEYVTTVAPPGNVPV